MICYINIAICLALAAVFVLFRNDIFWLLNALKYIRQGIASRYYPIIGYMKHADTPEAENGLERWYKLYRTKKDPKKSEPMIVVNGYGSTPLLLLNDKKLMEDYYKVDWSHTTPMNLANFPFQKSFFFQKCDKALMQRGIVAEIFYDYNLRKLAPGICQIMNRHLAAIKKRAAEAKEGAEGGFVELPLKADIHNIFRDVISFMLFGGEGPKVEGVPISDQIENVTNGLFMYSTTSFWHKITAGWSTKLGLSGRYNELKRIHNAILDEINKIVAYRKQSSTYVRGLNVVDLMIEFNEKMEAEGKTERVLSVKEILDNIFLLIFGGVETLESLSLNCVQHLSKHVGLQSEVRETVRNEIFKGKDAESYDSYLDCELLDHFTTECLRVSSPIWTNIFHLVTKNFKLGDYKVSKGSGIMVSFLTLQSKPEYFKNPHEFDLKKYQDKDRIKDLKKYCLIPFGAGKRSCLGKNLVKMATKMIVANILDQFELRVSEKPNHRFVMFSYSIKHCDTKVKALR